VLGSRHIAGGSSPDRTRIADRLLEIESLDFPLEQHCDSICGSSTNVLSRGINGRVSVWLLRSKIRACCVDARRCSANRGGIYHQQSLIGTEVLQKLSSRGPVCAECLAQAAAASSTVPPERTTPSVLKVINYDIPMKAPVTEILMPRHLHRTGFPGDSHVLGLVSVSSTT
jgi:hypothetical protein